MRVALLDKKGHVIGEVFDAPRTGRTVDVAGCFTASGDPVNVRTYKISRSKANLAKAYYQQPLIKCGDVFTFHHIDLTVL